MTSDIQVVSPVYVLPISADDPETFRAAAERAGDLLARPDPPDLDGVCRAAGEPPAGRYRRAVRGTGRQHLLDQVRDATRGPVVAAGDPPRVVFVFPGHGALRVDVARELLAASPDFAAHLRACDEAVREETGWSILEALRHGTVPDRRSRVQPLLWAVQVSLARVWRDWGVHPDAVVGYSMGEVAAAVVAGALDLRRAAAVMCRRSALLDRMRSPGDMWAVQLSEAEAIEAIGDRADRVSIAAINTDRLCSLSGDPEALRSVVGPLAERRVFCRRLNVNGAGHSAQVDFLLDDLRAALSGLTAGPATVPMYSTTLGRRLAGPELTAGYWADNLRRPVRFASACAAVLSDPCPVTFVEISPQVALSAAIEENIAAADRDDLVVPSLRKDQPAVATLVNSLGVFWERGGEPSWDRVQSWVGRAREAAAW
jgi:acyl transferase domain-containing protein